MPQGVAGREASRASVRVSRQRSILNSKVWWPPLTRHSLACYRSGNIHSMLMKGGTVNALHATSTVVAGTAGAPSKPRFGGIFWRLSRRTNRFTLPLAGSRWNPVFSVVEHLGRRSGRSYQTPVAARRIDDGFVVALAFGSQVDWYRNLVAANGGTVRRQGVRYPIAAPERIDIETALASFHPIQRFFLRLAGIDGYVFVRDLASR